MFTSDVHVCLVAQLCLTLCNPMDSSLPCSSSLGILQVRILEWVAMPSFKRYPQPRDQTQVSYLVGRFFTVILACNFLFCDIFIWFWCQGDGGLTEWVWELFCLCSCSGTFSEVKGSGCKLWMKLGFMACGGEDFDPQAVMRLDHSGLLCSKVLLRYKRDRESFWHRHQKGTERVPPCELFSSVQFSRLVVSDSLWPHELQHARPLCPSPTPGVHWNSCPSSRWCRPAISPSVIPFSSCPQSLPVSKSFPMSHFKDE